MIFADVFSKITETKYFFNVSNNSSVEEIPQGYYSILRNIIKYKKQEKMM